MKKITKILNEIQIKMTKIDYIIIGIIVALYATLSFINLGSMTNPQTFQTIKKDNFITINLKEATNLGKIKIFNGDLSGKYDLYCSNDNKEYNYVTRITTSGAFAWDEFKLTTTAKYIKLVPTTTSSLGEVSLYDNFRKQVPIQETKIDKKIIKSLTDEPQTIPDEISYLNSSYFDEIYFARTAYNYKEGMPTYEWTHPPLGKMLQALTVIFFNNMSPFFYRLMGNIAGIIMVFVMYIFGKLLFKKRKWAIVSSLLMFFDTFHFVQTRIGTVDSFLVLFIMLSLYFMYRYTLTSRKKSTLFLSGLFFALSICVKWTGFLGGLALAIIFFTDLFKERQSISKPFIQGTLYFVVLPLIIYTGIYLIYPNNQVTYTNSPKKIIVQTEKMYKYHSSLDSKHPYSSPWYSWPISYKSVWYYTKEYSPVTKGTITTVGNIVIWWAGILSAVISIYFLIKKKDKNIFLLLVSILSLWLPYIFIGRVMFLYHYFPVLPFMMLTVVAILKYLEEKTNSLYIVPVYLCLVVAFFILYYPVISGMPVSKHYIDTLKLFNSWQF